MKHKDVFIVVPTLNPNIKIMGEFIDHLLEEFSNIVVVNDGSRESYNGFFESLEKKGIIVLKHYINYGKGRGLKTAFNYILNKYDDCKCIVTADSDGQHAVKDILKCAEASLKSPNKLVLGTRDFYKDQVPFKSRYGNVITRNVFKIFIGLKITDTQTGLRALSREIIPKFMNTLGERFEYETNMLIECKNQNIGIEEVIIDTIYIDGNSESHFNPIKDSITIYKLFFKYIFANFSSFIIDILLFVFFLNVLHINNVIIVATVLARIISSIYNYVINRNLLFKNASINFIVKHFTLVIIQMFVAGFAVDYIYTAMVSANPIIIKIIVDIILSVISLIIRKEFI
ncbi:MAG: glycosyltransferase [Bacilli bacterium]|nr:glycosyltransferase [Bacilli bacterium]